VGVADDHVLYRAGAIDHRADLPPGGGGGLGEGFRELGGDDAIGGDAPAVDALESVLVTGREARGVAVELDDEISFPDVSGTV